MRGDCLSCARLQKCTETNVERVLTDYTCSSYDPVKEPVYWARAHMMEKFGDVLAVEAILDRPDEPEGEIE